MNGKSEEDNLTPQLSRIENQLETPTVPGELIEWMQATKRLFSDLLVVLREQIKNQHPKLIEEIVKQDPGLLSRVEHFRSEDQELLGEAQRQFEAISSLASRSDELEPDETLTSEAVESIMDEGLQLVIRIRKQEVAIDTWLVEAFDRDRGVAD